jgi:hypothetical protein
VIRSRPAGTLPGPNLPSITSLEKALRAMLDTRKDHLKVIFTGSSEDRLRTMFGAEDKAFYNWARVEPLPLLGRSLFES